MRKALAQRDADFRETASQYEAEARVIARSELEVQRAQLTYDLNRVSAAAHDTIQRQQNEIGTAVDEARSARNLVQRTEAVAQEVLGNAEASFQTQGNALEQAQQLAEQEYQSLQQVREYAEYESQRARAAEATAQFQEENAARAQRSTANIRDHSGRQRRSDAQNHAKAMADQSARHTQEMQRLKDKHNLALLSIRKELEEAKSGLDEWCREAITLREQVNHTERENTEKQQQLIQEHNDDLKRLSEIDGA